MIPLLVALGTIGLSLVLPKALKKAKQKIAELNQMRQEMAKEDQRMKEEKRRLEEKKHALKIQKVTEKEDLLAVEYRKHGKAITDKILEVLYLAALQQDIRFNLETEQTLRVVHYTTNDMEYVQISDASQLPHVSLSQMVLDDELFYHKFATRDLLCPEYYEIENLMKRMYILWDVSPSMYDPKYGTMKLPDGEIGVRDMWARAILASLLRDAEEGKAEYYLRPFSSKIHPLRSACTPKEAEILLSWIIKGGEQGTGTDIGGAVISATGDIRKRQDTDARMNHILLITDGDDNGGLLNKEMLVEKLGSDIKLHVVLIGVTYGPDHPLTPYVIATY